MGFSSPCLVSDLLSEQGTDTLDEYKLDVIKQAAMAVYLGEWQLFSATPLLSNQ